MDLYVVRSLQFVYRYHLVKETEKSWIVLQGGRRVTLPKSDTEGFTSREACRDHLLRAKEVKIRELEAELAELRASDEIGVYDVSPDAFKLRKQDSVVANDSGAEGFLDNPDTMAAKE